MVRARRRALILLAAGALFVCALGVRAQTAPGRPMLIHDPGGEALASLHHALARAESGEGRARVMIWGASHTSEDLFGGFLRAAWQRRFGDAGPGLVLPARPFALYENQRVRFASAGAWRPVRVRGRHRPPDRYGPAGFAIEARRRAEGFVEVDAPVDRARLMYLEQPGGGTLEARHGGEPVRLRTRGDRVTSHLFEPPGGVRRIEISARGDGPVRVFGVSLENARPGVIVDSMGVPGARLRDRLPWDDRALSRQLAELAPDLIVLAYGTNESGFRHRPIARYRRDVDEALRRARETAPGASCLLVGPSDWPVRENGRARPRARIGQVIAVQREMAERHGCGQVDLQAWQGGPLAMLDWVRAGLALPDHVHFTEAGHRRLAQALSRVLLRGRGGASAR